MQNTKLISILVAEDNIINQTLLVKMLSILGYTTDVVDNGSAAVNASLTNAYDLIFMDYQMPEMDGVEAAKCIKQNTCEHKPVIILMTANLLVNNEYLNYPGVLDDFLKKPFTMQEIKEKIEKWSSKFNWKAALESE